MYPKNNIKMIKTLKKFFGLESVDLADLISKGALIVDVRSPNEFSTGHVKGSINIPLEKIITQMDKLKKKEYVIVCCRSGNRSGMAKRMLNAKGMNNVTNGGSWLNVKQYC